MMRTPDADGSAGVETRRESEHDRPDRWEHGSHFELSLEQGVATFPWDVLPHSFWGSGRDALRGLLEWGREAQGWRRLLVPSYYCQHTLAGVKRAIPLETYPWSPTDPSVTKVAAASGDVVLAVAAFGVALRLDIDESAVVVEDHTHDPTSPHASSSRAQYAFASLRKTYPLPDGGVLWSPQRMALPDQLAVTTDHADTVLKRLSAMTLKRHHLDGSEVSRSAFGELYSSSERAIGSRATTGISDFSRLKLPTLPVARWRDQREGNIRVLQYVAEQHTGVRILPAPFAAVLVFDKPKAREHVRDALIDQRIYPAILWPLEDTVVRGIPAEHVDLSRRLLVVHADQRYTTADMQRVGVALEAALSAI